MIGYLESFIEQYHKWTLDYTYPFITSTELNYYLSQKKKRLENKGLRIEEDYEHVKGEITGNLERKSDPFSVHILYREARHILKYFRDDKVIASFKEPVVLYASLLDKVGYEDHLIKCDNCGQEAMASVMRNGCPYCGTRFEMEDVYPCFTSFYSVPGLVEREKLKEDIKKYLLIAGIGSALIVFVLSFISYKEFGILGRILISLFSAVFGGGMFMVSMYMLMSITLLIRAFWEAGRSLPLLGGINTDKKLKEKMKKYDPDFSYAYFEGRLISLFRSIAFSDSRKDLSIYTGDSDLSFLDDVLDLSYRGVSKLQNFAVEEGRIKIDMKIFMHNTYADNKLKRKDENFTVTIEKDGKPDDLNFNITKVHCPNCGSSFDAMHKKKCPYCGSEYKLVHDDWVISNITR